MKDTKKRRIYFPKILTFPKKKKAAKVNLYRKKTIIEMNTIGGKYLKFLIFKNGQGYCSSHKLYEFLFLKEEITNDYVFNKIFEGILPKNLKHCDFVLKTSGSIFSYDFVPKSLLYSSKSLYKKQVLSDYDLENYKAYFKCYPGKKGDIYRTLLLPKSSVEMLEKIAKQFHFKIDNVIMTSDILADCYKSPDENLVFLFRDFTLCTMCIFKKGYPVLEKSFNANRYMDFVRSFSLALGSFEKDYPEEKIDHYYLYEDTNQLEDYLSKIGIRYEKGKSLWQEVEKV